MPAPSRVVDILMEQGRQAAEAARSKGGIWGSTVQRLGEIPGEAVAAHQKQQQQQQEAAARQQTLNIEGEHLKMLQGDRVTAATALKKSQDAQALTSNLVQQHSKFNPDTGHWEYDHEAIVNGLMGVDPEAAAHYADIGTKIETTIAKTQNENLAFEARKRQGYADIFGSVANAPAAERPVRYGVMMGSLPATAKSDPVFGKLPPVYPGDTAFSALYDAQQTDAARFAKHEKTAADALKGFHETPPGGTLSRTDPDTGATTIVAQGGLPAGAAETERKDRATEARAVAAEAETVRHHRAVENRPPAAGGSSGSGASSDAEAIAGAIERGEQPPDVKGLYRNAAPVRAALARKGYDMTAANLDWQATQRHVATLNNSQQTRLRQSINTASQSLDVIDDLAKKWDAGRFPILNKANLMAAKNGAYGKDAASIATQLDGQITDVTSELGNVYMGGNSPTDHALQLAGKNLSASWDKKVLLDMTQLARTNLKIRNNSMMNVGVAGARPSNIYAPPPVQPAGGSISVTAPDGSKHAFATQAQADTFKKLAGIK